VELRHLRYFRVVAEELHYGRAAARLHMEPQPLNFQMKQLEREIGFALFDHREKRTVLTAAGAAFRGDVEDILAAAERAVEHGAMVARGESGSLRIGYSGPLVHAFLAQAIKRFRSDYPAVSFDLQLLPPVDVVAHLNRHELDLGFSILPAPDENFDALTIMRPRPAVAVAADDPLAEQHVANWADLDGRDIISLKHRFSAHQHSVDAMLAEHRLTLTTVQEADDFETALALVAVGIGIVVAPNIGVWHRDDVAFVDLPDDAAAAEYGAIWRRGDAHPLRAHFLDILATA
jgi:DNA-binding transcriptional LysR family regulator